METLGVTEEEEEEEEKEGEEEGKREGSVSGRERTTIWPLGEPSCLRLSAPCPSVLEQDKQGGTRDIGSALTRMCMRHRSIEAKLRQFSMVFLDCLINPLQEQMEEWKKVANTLDKDHAKEYKKARQEIKKKSSDTLKLQKKAKKGL
ncbi:unnamed protein product [Pleuronectes platessa]|uniref:IMD domain-containing protein n=1 Tax=Pleuronectes platessa TaxID=8262 RepID=A0A9N7TZZ6_PLEPL|nr:unnamed protein product [Pleuronectes platessa]